MGISFFGTAFRRAYLDQARGPASESRDPRARTQLAPRSRHTVPFNHISRHDIGSAGFSATSLPKISRSQSTVAVKTRRSSQGKSSGTARHHL